MDAEMAWVEEKMRGEGMKTENRTLFPEVLL